MFPVFVSAWMVHPVSFRAPAVSQKCDRREVTDPAVVKGGHVNNQGHCQRKHHAHFIF